MFHAHVGGMDTLARALLAADQMLEDGKLQAALDERYACWKEGLGKRMAAGEMSLEQISGEVLKKGINPKPRSGRQEWLENLVNRYF